MHLLSTIQFYWLDYCTLQAYVSEYLHVLEPRYSECKADISSMAKFHADPAGLGTYSYTAFEQANGPCTPQEHASCHML